MLSSFEFSSSKKFTPIQLLSADDSKSNHHSYTNQGKQELPNSKNDKSQALTNILLYQSQYMKCQPLFAKKYSQTANYFDDNTLNRGQNQSEQQSQMSEDLLLKFLIKFISIAEPKIYNNIRKCFQLLVNLPKKQLEEFDPKDYHENNQQLILELSDDEDNYQLQKQNKYLSSIEQVYEGSHITFGQDSQLKYNSPYGFNTHIKRRVSVPTTKEANIQKIKFNAPTLKDQYAKQCFKLLNYEIQIPYQIQRNAYKTQKMKELSKLSRDFVIAQNLDEADDAQSHINLNKKNQLISHLENLPSLSSIQVGELLQNSRIKQDNSINEMLLSKYDFLDEQKNKSNNFVKKIDKSIIVIQQRPISNYNNNLQGVKTANKNDRPSTFYYSPEFSPKNQVQQNQNIYLLRNKVSPQYQHRYQSPCRNKQPSINYSPYQNYSNSKSKPISHYSSTQNLMLRRPPQQYYDKGNIEIKNTVNVRYNTSPDQTKINFVRPSFYGQTNEERNRVNYHRPPPNIYLPNRPVIECRQGPISSRSAPNSPMFRNFRNAPPSNINGGGQAQLQFRRVNPEGTCSAHDSYSMSTQNTLIRELGVSTKPHSYYLGHLNNENRGYQQSTSQNNQQTWNQYTGFSSTQTKKTAQKNEQIYGQYYNCNRQMKGETKSKKKINLVTSRNQVMSRTKNNK